MEVWQGVVARGKLGHLAGPILGASKRNIQLAWLEMEHGGSIIGAYPQV